VEELYNGLAVFPSVGKLGKWVYVPPQLLDAIGWKKHGDTDGDPESFIFCSRNRTCIIPTIGQKMY